MNILFEYLYRDAGNNKKFGEVVFHNKGNIDLSVLNEKLRNALIDGEFFISNGSHLPKLEFDIKNELDHDWYEFDKISSTSGTPDDPLSRDMLEFISTLEEGSTILA
jgi:hypothetical protein